MNLDDLPTRFADALESAAARVRARTADRLESGVRLALFLAALMALTLTGLAFVLIFFHQLLAVWLGSAGASTALGGLFLAAGLLIWSRRTESIQGNK